MKPAAFFLLAATAAFAQAPVEVHVYNTARIPALQIELAQQAVNRIFTPAGIALRWVRCHAVCPEPEGAQAFVLGLAGGAIDLPTTAALGFAMLSQGKGNRAAISMPRVHAFSELTAIPLHSALAFAVAHELGHLFTRSRAHSTGIMRAAWTRENAARMAQGSLRFTSAEIERMRLVLNRPPAE